jgi:hypothetical protein
MAWSTGFGVFWRVAAASLAAGVLPSPTEPLLSLSRTAEPS